MTFNFEGKYWGDAIPHRPVELEYVKQVPLPTEDELKGVAVKARCIDQMTILEHAVPTRAQVRKINYDRRKDQVNNQGFVSLRQKPYKAIGDPVYLDTKKLITDTLGLPYQDPEKYGEKPASPTTSDNSPQQQSVYLLRRNRKQLNTLKKELDRGRSLLRNVRLGHGLFKVLQDDWNKTLMKRKNDEVLAKRQAMMDWQPATYGSESESGSDEDAERDDDITKYFVQLQPPHHNRDEATGEIRSQSQARDHVRFHIRPESHLGQTRDETEKSLLSESSIPVRQMSAPVSSIRRRKGHTPRPYTPIHNNISQKKSQHVHIVGGDEMGGRELNKKFLEEKRQQDQREYDNIFKQEARQQQEIRRFNKLRIDKKRPSHLLAPKRPVSVPRSRSGSIAQSQVSGEQPYTPMTENFAASLDDQRLEHENYTILEERSIDSSQTSTTKNVQQNAEPENVVSSRPPTRQPNAAQPRPSRSQLTNEELQQQERTRILEEVIKADSVPMERLSHARIYKATDAIKPKSSKELQEFKASCKSSLLINKSRELRESWAEVKEERALRLHDQLDYQEKNRLKTCQNKFSAMNTTSSSFYRALNKMRLHSDYMRKEAEKEKNKKQDQSKYAKWFEDLMGMIPVEYCNQWYFTTIIDKLRGFGITESSSKASEYKFTRVLKLIRPWEICSPNVAAAVEFCRDRIIEMNEDDFEELYQHIFPSIERPKTAPVKSQSVTKCAK